MNDELIYREGVATDQQQMKELGMAAYGQYAQVLTPENWARLQYNVSNEETYIKLLATSKPFVCVHNGKLVGMAFLVRRGNPTHIYPAEWCYIRMVGVDPACQGKGIARQLTQQCIDEAIRTQEQVIGLHTSEIMDAARHVYESLGFRQLKEIDPVFGVRYWLYKMELPDQGPRP